MAFCRSCDSLSHSGQFRACFRRFLCGPADDRCRCAYSSCTLPEFSRSVLLPSLLFPNLLPRFFPRTSRRAHKYARISGDFSLKKKKTLYEWMSPGTRAKSSTKNGREIAMYRSKITRLLRKIWFSDSRAALYTRNFNFTEDWYYIGVDKSNQVNFLHHKILMLIHLFYYKL